uniref:WAT1-related protein n=1 Tax=Brassica campestris TaxID=3711 RepID=M4E5M6_BRACM
MGNVEEYKPVIAMLGLQLCYAGVILTSEATLVNGTSPRVFILYRQAFATIFIFPFILFTRGRSKLSNLDLRSFSLIFMASLVGITLYQNLYFEGIYLASSSMGSAMGNIIPAFTFLISFLAGYEKVNFRNTRGLAKILGTVICVVGAVSMTLIRGPKILNSEFSLPIAKSLLGDIKDQNLWLLGCLLVFVSTLCWSFSLIIQGVVTSALSTTVQAWVISKRGPLFSAMFNPLCTVIVTILASMFLQEEMFTGGLIGGLFVIMGLYMVLWGKAKDVDVMIIQEQIDNNKNSEVKIQIEDSSDTEKCNNDLKKPLLS